MYAAGSFRDPSPVEYQASNREISIVTPAWNRESSPALYDLQFVNRQYNYKVEKG